MIAKIAKSAYLLILAVMVVAYALSPAKTVAPDPHNEPPSWIIFT